MLMDERGPFQEAFLYCLRRCFTQAHVSPGLGWTALLQGVPCSTDTASQVAGGWKGVKVSSELLRLHGREFVLSETFMETSHTQGWGSPVPMAVPCFVLGLLTI